MGILVRVLSPPSSNPILSIICLSSEGLLLRVLVQYYYLVQDFEFVDPFEQDDSDKSEAEGRKGGPGYKRLRARVSPSQGCNIKNLTPNGGVISKISPFFKILGV